MAAITIIRTYWQQKEHLIGAAFMLLFTAGVIFVLAAFRRKQKRCSAETEGIVAGYDTRISTDSETGDSEVYAPVFEYWYDGHLCRSTSRYYSGKQNYDIGQKVTLYINPDKPEEFLDYARERKMLLLMVAVLAGIALCGGTALIQ